LRQQPGPYQLLKVKGQRSRRDAELRRDGAGRQAFGTVGNQQAHHLQPDILRQCTKGNNRCVASDRQSGLDDMLKFSLHLGRANFSHIGLSRAKSGISADKRIPP
jgi:hypothetical protein